MAEVLRTVKEIEWGSEEGKVTWRFILTDGSRARLYKTGIETNSPEFRNFKESMEHRHIGRTIQVYQPDPEETLLVPPHIKKAIPQSFQDVLAPSENVNDQPAGEKPSPGEYYLNRLRHLLEKQLQHAADEKGLILIRIGIASTYRDCKTHGVGEQAKEILREFGIDPEARSEPTS